jgi:CRISPR-associated protein Csm3
MANKLLKKIEFSGSIELKTGLHIGGTNSSMQIGGIDKSVIRNPITNQPFIPGSSLKGKMRSLFEVSIGVTGPSVGRDVKNGPAKEGLSADLFGNATSDEKQKPSRLIVRDCEMINHKEVLAKTEIPYTEGKTEVVIDRITSAANPRQIERVPAGAEFALNMILNIWEQDNNENKLLNNLFKSMELLRDDYLGGSGSRGYGQIAIKLKKIVSKTTDEYYGKSTAIAEDITGNFTDLIKKLGE